MIGSLCRRIYAPQKETKRYIRYAVNIKIQIDSDVNICKYLPARVI